MTPCTRAAAHIAYKTRTHMTPCGTPLHTTHHKAAHIHTHASACKFSHRHRQSHTLAHTCLQLSSTCAQAQTRHARAQARAACARTRACTHACARARTRTTDAPLLTGDTDASLLTGSDCGPYWLLEHITDDKGALWFARRRRLRPEILLLTRALLPAGCSGLIAADARDPTQMPRC